jgi:hypothetical protein
MSRGVQLIRDLKAHVTTCMLAEPLCQPGENGLGNNEIEAMCDLKLELPSQDHYLTYSILQALILDGVVQRVRHPESPKRPKYRLTGRSDNI